MARRFEPLDSFEQILDQSSQCLEYLQGEMSDQGWQDQYSYRDFTNLSSKMKLKVNIDSV